ncbi:2-phosphosulfolactate phosphatase [Cellulomonas cellasea]|uniref:2-phosphosulfolactate phosphatase n=1 Tax=Cellulomonas cellasea TaxID=43670 RepID=UPI001144A70F|nr:2-phosphosulfolactate phosphatase [Cellulomonas cellasea]
MTSRDATSAHAQAGHRVRFDWALDGALAVAAGADVAVVVDVLSFTTAVGVALDAGTEVLPYRWADPTAAAFAERHDAVLALPRSVAGPDDLSLSPASIRAASGARAASRVPAASGARAASGVGTASGVRRLVLPSPNGSTICWHLAERLGVPTVLAASLRNAAAVARWVADRPDAAGLTVAVVAAGERWPGGGLRPAVEDAWGAAAVLRGLADALGDEALSPEARSAAALAPPGDVTAALAACASGGELAADGYAEDVRIAAEVDASRVVPGLVDGRFVDVARP